MQINITKSHKETRLASSLIGRNMTEQILIIDGVARGEIINVTSREGFLWSPPTTYTWNHHQRVQYTIHEFRWMSEVYLIASSDVTSANEIEIFKLIKEFDFKAISTSTQRI